MKIEYLKKYAFVLSLGISWGFFVNRQNLKAVEANPPNVQKAPLVNSIIAQGTWNTSKWTLTKEGADYVLHFQAGKLGAGSLKNCLPDISKWPQYPTKVVFDPGVVANANSSYLFDIDFYNVKEIQGLNNLDFSQVENMDGMFVGVPLKSVDLSNWNLSNVKSASQLFFRCNLLEEVNLGNWDNANVDLNGLFGETRVLARITMGPKATINPHNDDYIWWSLTHPVGVKIPGTNKVTTSANWVALNGPDKDKVYTQDELVNSKRQETVTYEWDSTQNYPETKAVTRTINIHQPNGNVKTQSQTAMLNRQYILSSDGSDKSTPWSSDTWESITLPQFAGYAPSQEQVEAQIVDYRTEDETIDIFYDETLQKITVEYVHEGKVVGTQEFSGYAGDSLNPHYRAPKNYQLVTSGPKTLTFKTTAQKIQVAVEPQITRTNETKTLTRTVNIFLPNGKVDTTRQVVVLKRTVKFNRVTKAKQYSSWSTGIWEAVTVPKFEDYSPDLPAVPEKRVTSQDFNQVVNVHYRKNSGI